MIRPPRISPLFPSPPLSRPPPLGFVARFTHISTAASIPMISSLPTFIDRQGRDHGGARRRRNVGDRESTRLNSRHPVKSYAGFCLEKKKRKDMEIQYDTVMC